MKTLMYIWATLPDAAGPVPAARYEVVPETNTVEIWYLPEYLQRPDAIALDPLNLPLQTRKFLLPRRSGKLGVIRDTLPDAWGRRVITKLYPYVLSDVDIGLLVGSRGVGALGFSPSPDQPPAADQVPPIEVLKELAAIAATIDRGGRYDGEALASLTALGGMRPKALVKDAIGNQWIAKFTRTGDTLDVPALEYATMLLTDRCGIDVPEVSLEEFDGGRALLVRRFDRTTVVTRHFLSALTLLGMTETDQGGSYREIAIRAEDLIDGAAAIEDMRCQLYRRMIFNLAINNTDDHLRNHGFLTNAKGRWALSPAYDLVPQVGNAEHAIGLMRGRLDLAPKEWLAAANQFEIGEGRAVQIIEEIATGMLDWQSFFEGAGVAKTDISALNFRIPSIKA